MIRALILSLALLLSGAALSDAAAQPIRVSAQASATTIGTSDEVTYTLRISGVAPNDVPRPDPPSVRGLSLRHPTPSTRRNMTLRNGQLTQSVSYTWTYRPVQAGTARFQPVHLNILGELYRTEEIQIEVRDQAHVAGAAGSTDPLGRTQRRERAITEADLFVEPADTVQRVYRGEQAVIRYDLYFRPFVQIKSSAIDGSWDTRNVWREDLNVEMRPTARIVERDGRSYHVITLKRSALFPARPGTTEVSPLAIEVQARARDSRQDPLQRFFRMTEGYEEYELASAPVRLEVEPLPSGAPSSFQEAVGSYEMRTQLSRQAVEVGEAVEFTIVIEGAGNIATLEAPDFEVPDAFDRYDPKVESEILRNGNQLRGRKTFEYVLVPRSAGSFTIPPVRFAFFDPATERYHTVTSDARTLRVAPGGNGAVADLDADRPPREADLAAPVREFDDTTDSRPLHRRPWTYALVSLPWLAALLFAFYRRRESVRAERTPERVRAGALVDERLDAAREALRGGRHAEAYGAIERALRDLLTLAFDRPATGWTRTEIDRQLAGRGIASGERDRIRRLLDETDAAQYAPQSHVDTQAALQRAERILHALLERLYPDVSDAA